MIKLVWVLILGCIFYPQAWASERIDPPDKVVTLISLHPEAPRIICKDLDTALTFFKDRNFAGLMVATGECWPQGWIYGLRSVAALIHHRAGPIAVVLVSPCRNLDLTSCAPDLFGWMTMKADGIREFCDKLSNGYSRSHTAHLNNYARRNSSAAGAVFCI